MSLMQYCHSWVRGVIIKKPKTNKTPSYDPAGKHNTCMQKGIPALRLVAQSLDEGSQHLISSKTLNNHSSGSFCRLTLGHLKGICKETFGIIRYQKGKAQTIDTINTVRKVQNPGIRKEGNYKCLTFYFSPTSFFMMGFGI